MYVCMYEWMVFTYRKGKDEPGKVVNPARGQLCPFASRIWSRETGLVFPRVSLLISILRLNLVLTYYGIPPDFRRSVQLFI